MNYKPKPKACGNKCGVKFIPMFSSTQEVCSTRCGIELTRKRNEKKAKEAERTHKKEVKAKLDALDRDNPWYLKKLQADVNEIVRLIDAEHLCISSQTYIRKGQLNAGHLYGVGSTRPIRFHLFNIFAQCVEQNDDKGGAPLEYLEGLKTTFGPEVKEYCYNLKYVHASPLKLSNEEIIEIRQRATGVIAWLKLQDRFFTTDERITLRIRFNKVLGIYPEDTLDY